MAQAGSQMGPELTAELYLYPTEQGGRELPIRQGFRCPAFPTRNTHVNGWTCFPHLGDSSLSPGEKMRLGFSFIHPDAAPQLRAGGKFYLWDGRFFGEAVVTDAT